MCTGESPSGADGNHVPNSALDCSSNDFLMVFAKLFHVEVTMGIDKKRSHGGGYLTSAPAGSGLSGFSIAKVSSPSVDAARSIPLLSTPMSLAGLRFATTTI